MLGNLGFGELMVILVIVLVLFGAKRVPEIGASIGKGIREFKRGMNDIDREVGQPIRDSLREPMASDRQPDRLPAGDVAAARTTQDDARPEPKRLL
jgi:sec-independent protein translocase protein TatA